ncbi:MAG: tRNA uridine-5-carboxymethylaminomethyl(34) synthesis GTPase MnmE [Sphingomonas bacterium]|nr:tRNA uridine-5-carboxymethylaminomethyl(34) synthesis GTPase MnmE [Sphingomonas bacterium]
MAVPSNHAALADTIYALSSGPPPAAIAIVRVSGPAAGDALKRLAGDLPKPRQASVRSLRGRDGDLLDRALILWLPGPATATGEDLAEFHLHGGRAVIEVVLGALAAIGLHLAEPGEFTRRALLNGRLDLGAVEGLADLLSAETEHQRREALRRADGALGRKLAGWGDQLLAIAARIEAAIDYDGDDEVGGGGPSAQIATLAGEIAVALAVPPAERLRDGIRIAIIGPPNAGKSSLFNALVGRDAAIVSDIAGTTRDLVERPVSIGGMPFVLVDTAGLRDTDETIERIGVERARREQTDADIVIDLEGDVRRSNVITVTTKTDLSPARAGSIGTSIVTGDGLTTLIDAITTLAATLLPGEGEVALDRRYRTTLYAIGTELADAGRASDAVLAAEYVRQARQLLDGLTGNAGIEDMLDALFGRFCLGK